MDIVVIKRNQSGKPLVKIITSLEWLACIIDGYSHFKFARDAIMAGGTYTYDYNGLSLEARAY